MTSDCQGHPELTPGCQECAIDVLRDERNNLMCRLSEIAGKLRDATKGPNDEPQYAEYYVDRVLRELSGCRTRGAGPK